MPTLSIDKKVTCSCLRAELGIHFMPMDVVLARLFRLYPDVDFTKVTREEFPAYYRPATNSLIRQMPEYLELTDARRAEIDVWMETRCTMCSFLVLRHIQQQAQQALEAA